AGHLWFQRGFFVARAEIFVGGNFLHPALLGRLPQFIRLFRRSLERFRVKLDKLLSTVSRGKGLIVDDFTEFFEGFLRDGLKSESVRKLDLGGVEKRRGLSLGLRLSRLRFRGFSLSRFSLGWLCFSGFGLDRLCLRRRS